MRSLTAREDQILIDRYVDSVTHLHRAIYATLLDVTRCPLGDISEHADQATCRAALVERVRLVVSQQAAEEDRKALTRVADDIAQSKHVRLELRAIRSWLSGQRSRAGRRRARGLRGHA